MYMMLQLQMKHLIIMFNNKVIEKTKYYYKLIKVKKIDTYLILVGIFGVIIGLCFSILIINKIFAWFILLGTIIRLYNFSEETQRTMIPYDFNSLLPPPPKK